MSGEWVVHGWDFEGGFLSRPPHSLSMDIVVRVPLVVTEELGLVSDTRLGTTTLQWGITTAQQQIIRHEWLTWSASSTVFSSVALYWSSLAIASLTFIHSLQRHHTAFDIWRFLAFDEQTSWRYSCLIFWQLRTCKKLFFFAFYSEVGNDDFWWYYFWEHSNFHTIFYSAEASHQTYFLLSQSPWLSRGISFLGRRLPKVSVVASHSVA